MVKKIVLSSLLSLLVFFAGVASVSADSTSVVKAGNINSLLNVSTSGGSTYSFVEDASVPSGLGLGALQVGTSAQSDEISFTTTAHSGTLLTDITSIGFWQYVDGSSTFGFVEGLGLALKLDLFGDGSTFATLKFEPNANQGLYPSTPGSWAHLDAGPGTDAVWSATEVITSPPFCFGCVQTIEFFSNGWPNAKVVSLSITDDNDFFWDGTYSGRVDGLHFGTSGNVTTYDFEPEVVNTPQSKEDCMSGGWLNLTREDGSSFNNQGQCISYFNTGI